MSRVSARFAVIVALAAALASTGVAYAETVPVHGLTVQAGGCCRP